MKKRQKVQIQSGADMHAHHDIPCIRHNRYGAKSFENPLEEHPCIDIVHIVLFRNELDEFYGHDKRENHASDWHNHRVRQVPNHRIDTAVPRLWRRADLTADFPDPLIHSIEKARKITDNTADENLPQPVCNGLFDNIQVLFPSFLPAPLCREAGMGSDLCVRRK